MARIIDYNIIMVFKSFQRHKYNPLEKHTHTRDVLYYPQLLHLPGITRPYPNVKCSIIFYVR